MNTPAHIHLEQVVGSLDSNTSGLAMDDSHALSGWLTFVSHRNAQTFRSYQAEAMRFRIFLETIHKNSTALSHPHLMRDARETDVMLYEAVLRGKFKNGKEAPQVQVPREIMIRHGRARQPFLVEAERDGLIESRPIGLKGSSVNQALTILNALYEYWRRPDPHTKTAYVLANPVKRIKSSSNRMQRQTSRNFPLEAITAMMAALDLQREMLAPEDEQSAVKAMQISRRRWVVALFFGLWGRRTEIAQLTMGDFRHNGARWTAHLKRKGGKEQDLPMAPWVVQELARYRRALDLDPLPSEDDPTPAIARLRARPSAGEDSTVHADTLYREITAVATDAAGLLRSVQILPDMDPVKRELLAKRLDGISPHWFRHSGASIAINSGAMSLDNASKMLGHSSPTITAEMYYHPDDALIEEGMEKLGAGAFG